MAMAVSCPLGPRSDIVAQKFLPFVANHASLAPVDWCPLLPWLSALEFANSSNWHDGLDFHEKPIHSGDLLHLQTSNPASTPAQVQGSVRFHTTLGQDDRMLLLRFGHS